MSDTYSNYAELAANEVEGTDYLITAINRGSAEGKVIIGIHGGGIEGGTSELTKEFAGAEHSYYLFEAIKSSGNTDLHITSTRFDEPKALALVTSKAYGLSFHGYSDSTNKHTLIGGADHNKKLAVYQALTAAGFSAEVLGEDDPLAGADPDNIVNRVTSGAGVQLELSTAQRKAMFTDFTLKGREGSKTTEFFNYVKALRNAF